jgi:hypothetical protein
MVIFYFVLLKLTDYTLHVIFTAKTLTTVFYVPNPNFFRLVSILLIIYVAFSYVANRFLLDLFQKEKLKALIYSLLADMLLIPFQIWIMIVFNNKFEQGRIVQLTSLYNAALITALFIIKNVIAFRLLNRAQK